ncbi:MAG: EFR1 family ferrodoxin [Deltaproteobacteria bacterium]|nr:EFR1 family ferrodoxin [Deltaproteobacteria bacterium]MBW2070690.1 EFR1 family ferrodoxin [Deltaproteobacteria bacterium]
MSDSTEVYIIYFSAAGSTRHVAEVMEKRFAAIGLQPFLYDLARDRDLCLTISRQIQLRANDCCLIVGSPVYVSHAAPPVMEFISSLPSVAVSYAVPFITWGGATSGIALYEMARELSRKGFKIVAAAKVLAVHSLMWQLKDPLGEGHPNSEDDRMIEQLVDEVCRKIQAAERKEMELARLAYQSKEVHTEMEKVSLQAAKAYMPARELDEEICTQCQICAEVCPTKAVTLAPYPVFKEGCLYCFSCMRVCPEGAIKADLSELWQRIREREAFFKEQPQTEIFV